MSDSRALGGHDADPELPSLPEGGEAKAARADRTKSSSTRSRGQAQDEGAGGRRPGVFARIRIFISQVVSEMKKVRYPSRNETWTYFTVVIVFVAVIMAYTGLLDLLFGKLNAVIFG
ncbi:preprotein translocase subunit SecE [Schaalia naturae]|uniref:Protein translocase subunit SecE n=1 Tax=Schaalia naturae TaxID=635203 RepID=A0ABW2SSH0_9ACTO